MMESISQQELVNFSERMRQFWSEARIPYPIHLSGGNEKQLIEIFKNVNEGDYIFSTHRSHYHYLLAGGTQKDLTDMIFEGRSMHVYDKKLNFLSSSIVAGLPCTAAGTALSLKRLNRKNHVWCFVGDGAEDEGHFYEAVRYVKGHQLPCTFIIEDNDRSVETKKADRYGSFEIDWPEDCVKRYHYDATYPHVGIEKFVDFSKTAIPKETPAKKKINQDKLKLEARAYSGGYREAIDESMIMLAKNPLTVFLGYNICHGSQAYGTLKQVSCSQKIEMPVAENLMVGLATGISIAGERPVVFFERQDFMLNALDSLVNHLDKIELMSRGQFQTPVIIRATVGAVSGIDPGPQHKGDYTKSLKEMLKYTPVYCLDSPGQIIAAYKKAATTKIPMVMVERKEQYNSKKSSSVKYL